MCNRFFAGGGNGRWTQQLYQGEVRLGVTRQMGESVSEVHNHDFTAAREILFGRWQLQEERVTPCCESGPMQWNWSWWARRGENTQILAGRPNSADFQSCCNTQWWARKINFPTEWQLAPWLSCVPWNFLPTPMSPRSFPQGQRSKTKWFPISTHTTPLLPAPYKQT